LEWSDIQEGVLPRIAALTLLILTLLFLSSSYLWLSMEIEKLRHLLATLQSCEKEDVRAERRRDFQRPIRLRRNSWGGILGCFPKGDKFGLGDGHSLSFQQQVMQVLVATAASEQILDVAIHCLHDSHRYFGAAVVKNALQVIEQHLGQLLKRLQPLPS
jgi:hypothetical protein